MALNNNGASTTVTLTVSGLTLSMGVMIKPGSGNLVFTPANTITDLAGNAATGTYSTGSAFKLF